MQFSFSAEKIGLNLGKFWPLKTSIFFKLNIFEITYYRGTYFCSDLVFFLEFWGIYGKFSGIHKISMFTFKCIGKSAFTQQYFSAFKDENTHFIVFFSEFGWKWRARVGHGRYTNWQLSLFNMFNTINMINTDWWYHALGTVSESPCLLLLVRGYHFL